MKVLLTLCAMIAAALTSSAQTNAITRTWTSQKGDKIDAVFVSEKNGTVYLKTPSGKNISVALSALRPEDVDWIRAAQYVPRTYHLNFIDRGRFSIGSTKNGVAAYDAPDTLIRDTVILTVGNTPAVTMSVMAINERGTVLTNKWSAPARTQGRFVCVHWMIKNDAKREGHLQPCVIFDDNNTRYEASEKENSFDFAWHHCSDYKTDGTYPVIRPGFSLNVCNIFEIPRDCNIKSVVVYELGDNPKYDEFFVPSPQDARLPSWKRKR